MKKTPFISIFALLLVIVIAFTGCETTISLESENTTDAVTTDVITTVVEVTDGSGEVVATENHTVIVTNQNSEKPTKGNSYVVKVTDKKGQVVSTEIATLSKDEVSKGDDFFNNAPITNNKPAVGTDKVTSGKTTTEKSQINKPETNNHQNDKPASDKTTEKVTENTQASSEKDDEKILNSNKFVISGRIVSGGKTSPFKVAMDGQMYAMVLGFDSTNVGFIMGDATVYMLLSSEKTYLAIPQELLLENDTDGSMEDIINGDFGTVSKKEVGRTKEKIDGVKYTVVEYEDGTLNYFVGKTLIKTESSDGSVLYYDEISSDVSAAYFVPPADYTEDELTVENLNKYTSIVEAKAE